LRKERGKMDYYKIPEQADADKDRKTDRYMEKAETRGIRWM